MDKYLHSDIWYHRDVHPYDSIWSYGLFVDEYRSWIGFGIGFNLFCISPRFRDFDKKTTLCTPLFIDVDKSLVSHIQLFKLTLYVNSPTDYAIDTFFRASGGAK